MADIKYHFRESEITNLAMQGREFYNEITVNYAYDYADGRFKASITKHNPISKILYDRRTREYNMKMLQHTRVAEKIADAILYTHSIPEVQLSFIHDIRSILLEVGDIARLEHRAVIGQDVNIIITKQTIQKHTIIYQACILPDSPRYSELLSLTQIMPTGQRGITITYDKGVATITVYADVQGYPPIEGAEVVIAGNKKITDKNGQVRFNLLPGTYTAFLTASGYEKTEITFTV